MRFTVYIVMAIAFISQPLQASVEKLMYKNLQIIHVGTCHSYDPTDFQYATLKKTWADFLQITGKQNCSVIVEQPSIAGIKIPGSFNQAIQKHADYGAAMYLAQQEYIPVIAGDPLVREAFKMLAESGEFNSNYVRYAHFTQLLDFYNSLKLQKLVDQTALEYVEKYFGLMFPGITMDAMINLHEQLTGRTFNPYDHKFYSYITWRTFSLRGMLFYQFAALKDVRKIWIAYHIKRDIATIALIKNELMLGRHVFIVYGSHHQEFHIKGIKALIKEITTQE